MSLTTTREQTNEGHGACDVTLIAGFLGAGKTTLLRRILTWPGDLSSTVVLVNEFGQIGIDGELLEGWGTPVVELTNGCICCTIQGDLVRTLREMLDRFSPARLLIEATGVADPFEILGVLVHPQWGGRLVINRVVTVVDADFWENREHLGPLFFNQIKAADLVLLNKVDLLQPEDVPRCLEEIQGTHPACAVVPTHHCQIDPQTLWKASQALAPDVEVPGAHEHDGHEDAPGLGFVAFAFEEERPFREECFRGFMEGLPRELYRVKGFALLDEGLWFVNHVGRHTEWVQLQGPGRTRLAFVGWKVEEGRMKAALRGCLHAV